MKSTRSRSSRELLLQIGCACLLGQASLLASVEESSAAPRTFATPQAAVTALSEAVSTPGGEGLRSLFGSELAQLQNPDRVQASNDLSAFAATLSEKSQLVRESSSRWVLEVGTNSWPFPIPITLQDGRWIFDTAAGKEELLNRRIGRNELAVLEVLRAYVDAQREYASRDRDGDQVLEYAQKLASSAGTHDGLYWPPEEWGEVSPLGPLVAQAQLKGYHLADKAAQEPPETFHGYYFKILTRQGRHAPGGKYDYVINGNMIGGFALVAWPAKYGDSGVMTFIVNQQGQVYQKDLGTKTDRIAPRIKAYDPDPSWASSPD